MKMIIFEIYFSTKTSKNDHKERQFFRFSKFRRILKTGTKNTCHQAKNLVLKNKFLKNLNF